MHFFKNNNRKWVWLLAGVATVGVAARQADDYFETSKNLEIFADVYSTINSEYVDDPKPGLLMRKGIDAMLGSLDPYTVYYSESQAEDALFMRAGEYGGVGCNIAERDGYLVFTEIFEGFAADKGGIRVGDKLIEINGRNVVGKKLNDIDVTLRGAANTKLSIVIEREGEGRLSKEMIRTEVKRPNVTYFGLIDSATGYIKLEEFMEGAGAEVKNAIKELKAKYGIKNLVLDLRGNPGGYLHEAVNIVNIFVPRNELVVITKGRSASAYKEYKTIEPAYDMEMPLVVLVNERSASASEIVSGALQDVDRALVVGKNSFGKGLVQTTRQLSYRTMVKFTVSKYYIPSGRCIQLLDYGNKNPDGTPGITPDSLRKHFKTKNGRPVLDGGGVRPDVQVDAYVPSDFLKYLKDNHTIFDFATLYRSKNATIAPASVFKITEQDFQEFQNFVLSKNLKNKSALESALNNLEKQSEKEKVSESLKQEIQALRTKVAALKAEELLKHKEEIMEQLSIEIARRYYYEKALIESSWNKDKQVMESLKYFYDKNLYLKTLGKI